ncbi:MAG: hypothetical protein ABSF84_11025 [Acidimicrobiales bacterium]|jgi:hypothetical protein
MHIRLVGGLGAGILALLLTGCSSSASSSSTTAKASTTSTTTSTTGATTDTTGASSAQELGTQFADAVEGGSPASFCTTYAVPSQVSECTGDVTSGKVSFKDLKVGDVTVQGSQAVITLTGTACEGSQCVSNSDPNAATDPESAVYAGSTFAEAFATANNPNSQNSSPFVVAGIQQGGAWYASGF